MRALYTAVSGLKSHQIKMDVISNNIANANTVGFKKSRLNFSEMMNQVLKTASGSSPSGLGGTNGVQIGLGVQAASMNVMTTQGTLQNTSRALDVAIQGEGYFIVSDGVNNFYTRNGNLLVDVDGSLVTSSGHKVLGKLADVSGNIENIYPLEQIKVPLGQAVEPRATEKFSLGNNLDSSAEVGSTTSATLKIYDSLGVEYPVSVNFTKTATQGEWDVQFSLDESCDIVQDWLKDNVPDYDTLSKDEKKAALSDANDALIATGRNSKIIFDSNGKLDIDATRAENGVADPLFAPVISFDTASGSTVTMDMDISEITQYSGSSNVVSSGQDGSPSGVLKSVTFNDKGDIVGVFSNGFVRTLGTLVTASFSNPEGLTNTGGGYYSESANSGSILYSKPSENGHGGLAVGMLELSNTDLSEELTEMIVTQRGYQMNSKTMLTVDEMLQELMNLKR